VVLRCAGPRNAQTASQINMDGANDVWDDVHGMKMWPEEYSGDSVYDDRLPSSGSQGAGPPPPLGNYQSPYAETLRSHGRISARSQRGISSIDPSARLIPGSSRGRSRYSEPISPGARRSGRAPIFGIQYGSGPLPPAEDSAYQHKARNFIPSNPGIDPVWLDQVVTKAVRQGVEESQRKSALQNTSAKNQQRKLSLETESQLPGAWPTSPFDTSVQSEKATRLNPATEHHGSIWGHSQSGWAERPAPSKAGTRVTWNDTDPVWESKFSANGSNTQEETLSDSWDTDETWRTRNANGWKDKSPQGGTRVSNPSSHRFTAASPVTIRIRGQGHSKNGLSVRLRSKSSSRRARREQDISSSPEDQIGWGNVDTTSSSAAGGSSDDTVQPSHAQSQVRAPRRRSEKRSYHSRSAHPSRRRLSHAVPYAPSTPDAASRRAEPSPFDIGSISFPSWDDNKKTVDENDVWGSTAHKKGSWKDVGHDNWSSDIDEQVADGWKAAGKASWSTAYATQDTESDAWNRDFDMWKNKPFLEEQSYEIRKNTARDKTKPGWDEATQTTNSTGKVNKWKVAEDEPKKAASASKRHSIKPLSKYPQLYSASDTGPKSHWQFPPPPPSKTVHSNPNPKALFIAPKEPLHKISQHAASEKGIEHQVQAGKAMHYGHAISHPDYIDHLDNPVSDPTF